MSEPPCVGAGITVVDPGPNTNEVFKKRQDGRPYTPKKKKPRRGHWLLEAADSTPRLLRAYVTAIGHVAHGAPIYWKCGTRVGTVYQNTYGVTWVAGHGPQARGALLAQRALERPR